MPASPEAESGCTQQASRRGSPLGRSTRIWHGADDYFARSCKRTPPTYSGDVPWNNTGNEIQFSKTCQPPTRLICSGACRCFEHRRVPFSLLLLLPPEHRLRRVHVRLRPEPDPHATHLRQWRAGYALLSDKTLERRLVHLEQLGHLDGAERVLHCYRPITGDRCAVKRNRHAGRKYRITKKRK